MPANPESKESRESKEKSSSKQKVITKAKFDRRVEDFKDYARTNPGDAAALAVLVLGIITFFVLPFWGGILIGIIAGIYYSHEIIEQVQNIKAYIDKKGLIRSLIPLGILIGLFLAAPSILLAAAAVAAIIYIFSPQSKK